MLHEVLLALSGHPSPLFADQNSQTDQKEFPLISPSERALLRSIGRLSELHRKLKSHLESISAAHPSIICRSVASSILHTHLARFQKRILDVEGKILTKDASLVGAYEIVPLASVVGEFDDWHRRMAWYWQIACFFQPLKDASREQQRPSTPCSSAQVIDKLRAETQTGFPDIEEAATQLAKVAETAWLKQLSSWIIYGKLPAFGAHDFFIHVDGPDGQSFSKDNDLLPTFVSSTTASSILFIGKSLHQVKRHRQAKMVSIAVSGGGSADADLAMAHLSLLAALPLPLIPSQFSRTISEIRLSLSQNVLQQLLPMSLTRQVLMCLRHFFLLGRGDFAVALINEAESRVQSRQQSMGRLLQQDPVKAMQSLSVKDAELHQALQQVWKALAAEDSETTDAVLDYARQHISLSTPKAGTSRPSSSDSFESASADVVSTAFNDLLVPSPTELSLSFSSPVDLFLSTRDVDTYSAINSYLLAIRRSHQKASDLWRRSPARRDHPVTAQDGNARQRNRKRTTATRKVWATLSAANFLLSETSAFFEGEIITGSCSHFQEWTEKPATNFDPDVSAASTVDGPGERPAQRDPETLAAGHRTFLASLTYALLLTDTIYTRELRTLLGNIDNMIAFFTRLLDVQQKLDLEAQDGAGESPHTVEAEQHTSLELDRARKKVDSGLKAVVNRLRQLDLQRIGSLRYLDVRPGEKGDFEVWKGGGGVDRLLMKLEFGRMVEGGMGTASFDLV
ncbi:related to gamma-tubulin complex component GCP4 [Lecanosticta acicola]|uniref:Spindle pole body component n=1 Tax=Lecanosticta acicola TaxID=111012 RepID=A0AAI8YU70_9PEZI|nr:related to gamma-tubulin complex component GCP4 [Lecanosticta acicola]